MYAHCYSSQRNGSSYAIKKMRISKSAFTSCTDKVIYTSYKEAECQVYIDQKNRNFNNSWT